MRINIVGAGAMGSLLGALLAKAGHEVWLLDIWEDHVNAIQANGLGLEMHGQLSRIPMKAARDASDMPKADLALVMVKSYQTESAAQVLPEILEDKGLALSLQNGLGNLDIIGRHWPLSLSLAGITTMSAQLLGPGRVKYNGGEECKIGFWGDGDLARAEKLAACFSQAGMKVTALADIRPAVWEKLLVNAAINPLTALANMTNGASAEFALSREIMCMVVAEGQAVAQAANIKLRDDILDYVLEVARVTGTNLSSMWQDVHNKRFTEIDFINGALVKAAARCQVAVPVNQTLTALIKARELSLLNR